MKLLLITNDAFVPDGKGGSKCLYRDSIVNVDDDAAGLLIVAGRAQLAPENAKPRDMTKQREEEAAQAAAKAQTPEGSMTALIAAAVGQAVAAALAAKPAEPVKT